MNLQTYKTTLSKAKQTAVPAYIINKLGLNTGDNFIWSLASDNKTLNVVPVQSQKLGDYLSGLGKYLWKDVDVEKYIKEGRQDRTF